MDDWFGNIGLYAFIFMAVISLVRFVVFLRTFRRDGHRYRWPRQCRSISIPGCSCFGDEDAEPLQPVTSATQLLAQRKLEIHALVFSSMLIEIPVYSFGYQGDEEEHMTWLKSLYPLHMFAFVLLYCAFGILVNIWVKFVDLEVRLRWLRFCLLLTLVLYVPFFAIAAVSCYRAESFASYLASTPFFMFGWYNIVTLLLLASGFLVVGCMLQLRICQVLGNDDATPDARYYQMLCRLNVVMFCCTFCFLLRAIMFGLFMATTVETNASDQTRQVNWQLVMYEEWIPATLPCLSLLYLMRDAQNAGPPAMVHSPQAAPGTSLQYRHHEMVQIEKISL